MIIKHGRHIVLEVYKVRKGLWVFFFLIVLLRCWLAGQTNYDHMDTVANHFLDVDILFLVSLTSRSLVIIATKTRHIKGAVFPIFPSAPKCSSRISSFIESAYVLSNPFPSKPSIVFLAQKPFYSQFLLVISYFFVLLSSSLVYHPQM